MHYDCLNYSLSIQVLTCAFVSPDGDANQQAKVIAVAKEWERYANIKFDFESAAADPSSAIIRISFGMYESSWSAVGNTALNTEWFKPGEATMNLAAVYGNTPLSELTLKERRVILHEFGHAIGYLHEHQSPERGRKLTIKEKGQPCCSRL